MNQTPVIHVAKIAESKTLSLSASLTYHLGYAAGTTDQIYIRIVESSGQAKFNTCWWSLAEIEKALASFPAEAAFTSSALKPVFAGRSVNTMYFVLAALLDCGLIARAVHAETGFVRNTPKVWLAELQSLIEAGTSLVPDEMGQHDGHTESVPVKPTKKSARQTVNV